MIETQGKAVSIPTASGYGPGEAPEWEYYSKCIHCGLCLNSCPTYRELGLEMDSPRGRIYQMVQVERGRLPLGESFVRHIDSCLDCRACETACPSGVEYGRLVESARAQINRYYSRSGIARHVRHVFFQKLLPDRKMLDRVGTLLWLFQQSGLETVLLKSGIPHLLSKRLGRVAALSPRMEKPFFTRRLGQVVKSEGDVRYRVAFFAGCIANLAFARLNDATVRVLVRNGCEVVIPEAQGCCGALHVHAGIRDTARELAKQNIRTFLDGNFDYFITNAAGCGSVLKEYPLLFEHEDREFYDRAREFSSRVRDVTEFLAGIEFNRNFGAIRSRATYQDPCHLGHAQRIRSAPRRLMAAIPGLELVELKESEVCCGSAGIYNVVQNEMADRLLKAKMQRVDETGAELIVTANPGCLLQLRAGVSRSGQQRRVLHVVELLDEAYGSGVQAG
ncbi:MAG TPA: (Fe-S)-binding protein [Terriglobia bacterium]|nr:(Fe-S)-binding protein [Terriglobia bacterium]